MKLTDKQFELLDFVKHAHSHQVRKYTNEPYWTHPYTVAEIVNNYVPDQIGAIEIALLHDVVEDTFVTVQAIVTNLHAIGYTPDEVRVIELGVIALTDVYTVGDFDHMNRKERKAHEATRLAKIHPEFQNIKYADLIHNTGSIVEHDKGFAKTYLAEKRTILNGMRGGNLDLFVKCYKTLLAAEECI